MNKRLITILVSLGLLAVPLAAPASAHTRQTVAVVGDSITVFTAADIVRDFHNYTLEVSGAAGTTMAERLPTVEAFAATNPWAFIVELGTNDALLSVPGWQVAFQNEVNALEGQRCVVLLTLPDTLGAEAVGIDQAITYATWLHSNFHALNWGVIGYSHPKWVRSDGIHPTGLGSKRLAQLEIQTVRQDCR
jgi:hypothetical protein